MSDRNVMCPKCNNLMGITFVDDELRGMDENEPNPYFLTEFICGYCDCRVGAKVIMTVKEIQPLVTV